ncbi:MAG TPA: hypothetical protein VFQ65_05470 [Kofleriaceae bacterium]|nr:hypothetical protein [Kofleriaceae bacterium]
MRSVLLISITAVGTAAAGCTMPIDATHELRIEPATIAMDVDLAGTPPKVALHVVSVGSDGTETDVTTAATYAFTGPQLGAVAHGQLASDGLTGGATTLAVTFHELAATIDVTANVHGRRIVDGAQADAFAGATAMPAALQLVPGDGVVLPPNLGELDVAWTADPAADTHRVHITAPYLDVEVDAPGASAITLAPNEWQAVARTARSGAVNVDVASLQSSAPAIAQVASATYRIADLDASDILFGAMVGTDLPVLARYAMKTATTRALFSGPEGGCVGCHIAVSADGTRIAAGVPSSAGGGAGVLFDATNGTILATSDAMPDTPWNAAAFDPSGAMIASTRTGGLAVRDRSTAALIQPIAMDELATSPTISPDGSALAYTVVDTGPAGANPGGAALHVRPWNVATAAIGTPIELVRDGRGVVMPVYSPDGRWIAYAHSADPTQEVPTGAAAVRSDGSGRIVELTTDPLDQNARWASPVVNGFVWIAMVSARPFGALPAGTRQLWLEQLDTATGTLSPAIHLPGQGEIMVLHGPLALSN